MPFNEVKNHSPIVRRALLWKNYKRIMETGK